MHRLEERLKSLEELEKAAYAAGWLLRDGEILTPEGHFTYATRHYPSAKLVVEARNELPFLLATIRELLAQRKLGC